MDSLLLTKDGVGVFDPEDRLIFCNDAFGDFVGQNANEVINKTFSEICFYCFNTDTGMNIETDNFQEWINSALLKRRVHDYRTFETDGADNKYYIVTEQMVHTNYVYTYITDITEKKENELKLQLLSQELEELATTDFLTSIRNRRYFYQTAKAQFNHSVREDVSLSILMLDLDKFKFINDTYGHNAGDIVLQMFTKKITHLLRDYDIFARIGGEEFAIMLPATDSALAYLIAERIRKTVESMEINVCKEIIKITTSIGLSERSNGITSFDEMMQLADKCLNQAKLKGRNNVFGA